MDGVGGAVRMGLRPGKVLMGAWRQLEEKPVSEGLPSPCPGRTSVRMRMATFLSRSSLLCRLGSSWLVTALICWQRFCTMALGRGEEGRVRVWVWGCGPESPGHHSRAQWGLRLSGCPPLRGVWDPPLYLLAAHWLPGRGWMCGRPSGLPLVA